MATLSKLAVSTLAVLSLISSSCIAVAVPAPGQSTQQVLDGDAAFTEYRVPEYPEHAVRIRKQNDDICNAGSSQYTGWIDNGGKHIFFCAFLLTSYYLRPDPNDLYSYLVAELSY